MEGVADDDEGRGSRGTSLRAKVYDMVDGEMDSIVEYFIMLLILANVVSFLIGTLVYSGPGDSEVPCPSSKHCLLLVDAKSSFFEAFELFSIVVFTIEYLLRVWCCLENPDYGQYGPILGRLSYMTSFFALIDFFAISPYYLAQFGLVREINYTTALRLFRLIRLLKAEKYLKAFGLLDDVLAENGPLLTACLYYACMIWLFTSTAMYFTERYNPEVAVYFQSIPDSMFPVALFLTGEFPLVDFTPLGKFIAGSMAVVAVAFFAIPTAVLGSGFVRAVEQARGIESED